MKRKFVFLALLWFVLTSVSQVIARPPNFIIILADDLGYGDLACYGHPTIRTPHLDRMAAEGMRFTDFYVAATVCTPSRAALLTGRLPIRTGMAGSESRRVLYGVSTGGLPTNEITIARALKSKNYVTGCVGKWHLGHLPQFLPTSHGFDSYFGLLWSNDMEPNPDVKLPRGASMDLAPDPNWWKPSLHRNEKVIEHPADQSTLTKRYTEEATKFIRANKKKPFFLYFPQYAVHLFASKDFKGKSARGLYGDTVEELDWSVGQVLDTLRKENLAENTLVFFTSDNGPWLIKELAGGSAGLLTEGKGSTWEGGLRAPAIAWWPKKIKPGAVSRELASSMDLFKTCLGLAGVPPPTDRVMDGFDLSPVLFQNGKSQRDVMFYYRGNQLFAVRKGEYKAHFQTAPGYAGNRVKEKLEKHEAPLLFNLNHDPSENFNIAVKHPEVLADIQREVEKHRANLNPATPQY